MVFWWKCATRAILSDTTSARWRCGSCVATPVGQRSVWQLCDWMQPSANMKPRAELHQSAPSASRRAMSKAVMILPEQPILIFARRLAPTRVLCTSTSASCSGVPTWSVNSSGAAPVPPSLPSTTMKSGVMPVASMALTMAKNSHGWPMASLKPVGLPPDRVRRRSIKCSISSGVEKALCAAGETQSSPTITPRVVAISMVTLGPGSTPPWPGLAPCDIFSSIILTCPELALAMKRSSENVPSWLRQPK